ILRLALPSPLRRLFDYLPPQDCNESQFTAGQRLRVPFGRQIIIGVLVEITNQSDIAPNKLRRAIELLDTDPIFSLSLLNLCTWASNYYHYSLGETFHTALPAKLRQGEPAELSHEQFWVFNEDQPNPTKIRTVRQQEIINAISQHTDGLPNYLVGQLNLSKSSLNTLKKNQIIRLEKRRKSFKSTHSPLLAQPELSLNAEQKKACSAVLSEINSFHAFLLAGVTGSGKTEVYLQLMHAVICAGKQVLMLIPEINLSPQTVTRIEQRFNTRVAVLHSSVNDKDRLEAWLTAKMGVVSIIIGTRLALFTPTKQLGLIIIDEEHDASYKQQEGMRYHARDLALVRAQQENIPILLGSATPSLESLYNTKINRYQLLSLKNRAGQALLPKMQRIDVKSRPLDSGFSEPLKQAIQRTLKEGHQVLIFINRRGFAPVLLCHQCGWVSQCPRCKANMVIHQSLQEIRCHHCMHHLPLINQCPVCLDSNLKAIGLGTERAENFLSTHFPQEPIIRIDRDTMQRKESIFNFLEVIHTGKPCILIGTQMLAKGHHFPNVTLVAILDVDGGLFSADFRATERMAQIVTQVAGRAGREKYPGEVIIQSHAADHPLLVQLTDCGYFSFAETALNERKAMDFPPFSYLALLRAEAYEAQQAESFLDEAYEIAYKMIEAYKIKETELLGPAPAPMELRAGKHRFQLLIQAKKRNNLHYLIRNLLPLLSSLPLQNKIRWSLDIDPIDLF
ncbi:UNVERIFIED_CONTAM: hypothetical protein GTU68_023862, partial [Idotea baltica]|nr:hypothetical protein [Idotea baltica]